MTDPGQILQELEQAVDSIEQSSVSIADSAEIQSDVISGGINDFVTTPYGPIRTLSNAINVISQTNPTGAWQTATAYNLKDLVVEANIIYLCTFPHTSTSFAADLLAGYWAVYQNIIAPTGTGPLGTIRFDFANTPNVNSATYTRILLVQATTAGTLVPAQQVWDKALCGAGKVQMQVCASSPDPDSFKTVDVTIGTAALKIFEGSLDYGNLGGGRSKQRIDYINDFSSGNNLNADLTTQDLFLINNNSLSDIEFEFKRTDGNLSDALYIDCINFYLFE